MTGLNILPTVSVVIAAFSMERWGDLSDALSSVQAQTRRPLELIVVIDHNLDLLAKANQELRDVTVLANTGKHGASSARNTGVDASRGEVVAFLDDDAVAAPIWLEALLQHFGNPSVVGVGGRLEPLWKTSRPRWFPHEFDWAVGASYRGMPELATPVRNVWSGNMAIRREAFDAIGGFRAGFGKIGNRSRPEDTDLCLRAAQFNGGSSWIYEPAAIADHRVPVGRTTLGFFLTRCFHEGRGKAALTSLNGVDYSTSAERIYAQRVLPRGILRGILETARGDISGAARSFAILAGLSLAIVGFVIDRAVCIVQPSQEAIRLRIAQEEKEII